RGQQPAERHRVAGEENPHREFRPALRRQRTFVGVDLDMPGGCHLAHDTPSSSSSSAGSDIRARRCIHTIHPPADATTTNGIAIKNMMLILNASARGSLPLAR